MSSSNKTPPTPVGEGDSFLVLDFLPPDLADAVFEQLRGEVQWNLSAGGPVPRLVAVEGEINPDGTCVSARLSSIPAFHRPTLCTPPLSYPIYRHPADESPPLLPFSPTVARIRRHVQDALQQPVNHVLIQHYRSGADYISEHSDKTVDVVRGSRIVNVSVGAQRVMTLRTKKDAQRTPGDARAVQRVLLPHNSMFVLGPATNMRWLHGIRADKRPQHEKAGAECRAGGERISLTFRHIGTFLTPGEGYIYGQGAKSKTRDAARPVVRGGPEAEELLAAFGAENHASEFDWEVAYGEGSDVLHFSVFNSGD
ncbi:uncharacterized protein FIBRA_08525 [Fibroporia radiculosa]|uniref:Fe2OG dioxygenase domain-containing protein n=1 Tax=Fibroporia radiculosa TaxID=599839 RepID=J4GWZ0_9APHY|nr:uncharacterized protein FIBRA_08525 [Fibroporia radiculosa]CCM06275.1 predicted protein [Fibroporia radiculosa]